MQGPTFERKGRTASKGGGRGGKDIPRRKPMKLMRIEAVLYSPADTLLYLLARPGTGMYYYVGLARLMYVS
jgi:hypothetical protein